MEEVRHNPEPRRIYRCGGRLQAGTSHMELPGPLLRENIRNGFLNPAYILSGSGFHIDAEGRRFRFGPGTLLIRFSGMLHHQLHNPGSYIDKYFALPAEYEKILIDRQLLSPERPLIELGTHPHIAGEFDALADLLEREAEEKLILTMNEFFRFFCGLLLAERVSRPHHAALAAGAELLARNLEQRISVEEVAAKVGMPYPKFRRIFTRQFKVPPAEYRIRRRLEKLQSLLTGSDIPLKELASRFGYADVYTFTRQFRLHTGIPPGEFRRRMRF
ncbi:MAG: helix-turn-helix transcriptional regulator [Lentisphaeria bacterium]|nr:helix-turn-helix transcriptional regulator [Lentisphaeria bacterium]